MNINGIEDSNLVQPLAPGASLQYAQAPQQLAPPWLSSCRRTGAEWAHWALLSCHPGNEGYNGSDPPSAANDSCDAANFVRWVDCPQQHWPGAKKSLAWYQGGARVVVPAWWGSKWTWCSSTLLCPLPYFLVSAPQFQCNSIFYNVCYHHPDP